MPKKPPDPREVEDVKQLIKKFKQASESLSPTRGTEMLRLSREIKSKRRWRN
jgi:hypothetical protein